MQQARPVLRANKDSKVNKVQLVPQVSREALVLVGLKVSQEVPVAPVDLVHKEYTVTPVSRALVDNLVKQDSLVQPGFGETLVSPAIQVVLELRVSQERLDYLV